jgi:hypothetical protein
MRRLSTILVLALASSIWPAAVGSAPATAQAVGSLQADFDNDGFTDLAVGVAGEDIGGLVDAGAVNVLYGSAGGLTTARNQQFWQGSGGAAGTAEAGDEFGFALAVGDFNNDDFADLAVGVPFEAVGATGGAGAVDILYGSAGGLTGNGSQLFTQGPGGAPGTAEAGDLFGLALSAGDYNNDGSADLAVGVPFEGIGATAGAGAVDVLFGSATGLTGAGGQQFWQGAGGVAGSAEADDEFGRALASGDFDDDGDSDLAVGVPLEDLGGLQDAGAVQVLPGSAGGLTGTGSQLFTQDSPGVPGTAAFFQEFGTSLAAADFNADGPADLAVGVPRHDSATGAGASVGAVTVLYGTGTGLDGAGSQLFTQDSAGVVGTAEEFDLFGYSLAAGDFNNNGSADLAVGVPGEDIGTTRDAGAFNVLYGAGGGLSGTGSQLFNQGGGGVAGVAEADDVFAATLSAGDFNANGFADLAVGAFFEDIGSVADAGAVTVLYGAGNGLDAAGDQQFWQGANGLAGVAEEGDIFTSSLVGSDQQPGSSAATSRSPRRGVPGTS